MKEITVVGLGAGDFEQLPMGVYRTLKNVKKVYMRTLDHPVVAELQKEGVSFISFDEVYEKHDEFLPVYQEIASTLIEKAEKESVLYAVPGHPLVAEMTIQLLIEAEKKGEIQLSIEGGQSFLDAMFTTLKIDPIDGFQMVDGATFSVHHVHMQNHLLIAQVYDQISASHVKLTLMEKYPDDYEVTIVTAAGSKEEVIKTVPLYELDHVAEINNLTTVYVPPVQDAKEALKEFSTLREIIATLRSPEGCEWDRAQTHESLTRYLLEEAHEAIQAVNEQDDDHMIEEFGDLLMLVLMNAQIGEDEGYFNLEDIIQAINEKMIRRHPHVFGDVQVENVAEINANWEKIKKEEHQNYEDESVLKGEYRTASSLQTSYNYQKKAAKLGFEWGTTEAFWGKVEEELAELREAIEKGTKEQQVEEFGDVLTTLVNVARHYKISAEEAMVLANAKFAKRFGYVEQQVKSKWEDYSVEALLQFWQEAKDKEGESL
ncbi:nucleoside triphosphate pyrophosphohydrolase [Kurthia sp. FSL E2-0154]|uniref:nucleoside triphosphate pyrophosphohydrolase n=1 Tax=Kurthia sp. FSL E2-0154 TaxID=2921358 RepID=UPI0030F9F717